MQIKAPRRRKDKRSLRTLVPSEDLPPIPVPGTVTAEVHGLGGNAYLWLLSVSFDDSGVGGWTELDFVALQVDDNPPIALGAVNGAGGWFILVYGEDDAGEFEILAAPSVLQFTGGQALLVPQSGSIIT